MEITDVRFCLLRAPLKSPIRLAWGDLTHRNYGLVYVDTDEGVTGVGETSINFPAWAGAERRLTIEEGIRPLLVGRNPLAIANIWESLYTKLGRLGVLWGKGAIMSALGGVDIALWDVAGKIHGLPVHALIGGSGADRIPLYATGFDINEPEKYVEDGYRGLKVRIGFDPGLDLAAVARVREAIGSEVDLLVDVNMGWSRREALEQAPKYDDFDLYWLEEPVRADDLEGYRLLAQRLRTPLAAGENAFDRQDSKELLDTSAISHIMPDPGRAGGITEARRICELAWSYQVPYSPHHYGSDVGFAAALHLMAATPNGGYLLRDVSDSPLREAIVQNQITVEDGYAVVPQGPGLGIELDDEMVKRHAVD